MDDQVRHLHQPSARHANDLRRHHHKAPSTSCATTKMAPRASLRPRHQASMTTLAFEDLMNEENEDLYFAKLDSMSLPPPLLQDGHKTVEHGIFPSTMEASNDAHLMEANLEGDKVKNGEHGIFPSPKEAHEVEKTEPIPICLSDDVVPIPSEYESHLAHLSENKSEMSDSTLCEIECFHLEGISDIPSELRVVVDRSSETILISNNLPSTSSVFSCVVLGSMDEAAPSHGAMMPQLEKMYMVHKDDAMPCIHQEYKVVHKEATTSTTPTSYERYHQGNNKGVDDAMIPLVDMMNCEDMHAMDDTYDITYASSTFPCDALPLHNINHVELFDCYIISINMPCYASCMYPPIALDLPCHASHSISPVACDKMNACYFNCFACNNIDHMRYNEMAPIAFSIFIVFDDCHDKHVPHLHTHHASISYLIDINGDVHKKRYVMIDDVYLYHAHTFFLLHMMCVGTRTRMSTSVKHELTKRALESIPQVSSRSNPALIPFACFAYFMLANCSFLWFDCKHVNGIIFPCDIHVSSLLDNVALCVATKMLNNLPFRCFVCNHNSFKNMYCHESFQESRLVVATNIRTTCSFIWFVCKHNTFVLDMLPFEFLPNSPSFASKMLIKFLFD